MSTSFYMLSLQRRSVKKQVLKLLIMNLLNPSPKQPKAGRSIVSGLEPGAVCCVSR